MARFRWTQQAEQAAALIAQGNLSMDDIAARAGVVRKTLYSWRQNATFRARVDGLLAEFRAEVRRIGLATVEKRVAAQNDRWVRMRSLIEARADDPALADVPGGTTGLLVRTVRKVVVESDAERGPRSTEVAEFAVDAALLREIREVEKQAAIELGQWQARLETNAPDIRAAVDATRDAGDSYVDPDEADDDDPDG